MKVKNKLLILITLVLLFAVSACSKGESASSSKGSKESAKGKSELKLTLSAQPPTLDTVATNSVDSATVARNVFETLVTPNSKFQPTPMLAKSVDISDDGKTYTFVLRQGVKFHNGKEMTSEDVVASMNRWKEASVVAKGLLGDAAFEAKDKYTVTLQLQQPSSGLLNILASTKQFPAIMPKEIVEKATPEGVTEFIGTGPFKVAEVKQNQFIHLTKNEDYQPVEGKADGLAGKKEALVDDVYFYIVKDAATRLSAIQTGEYDINTDVYFEQYDIVKKDKNITTFPDQYGNLMAVYNKKSGLFTDQKMRQAINTAINAEDIMLATFSHEELFQLDHGYMSKDQKDWYTKKGLESYNQNDAKKAKELLKEAGYNGQEIKIIATSDYSEHYDSAVVLQQQLNKLGVNAKLETFDWPTLLEKRKDPAAWDILVTGYSTVTTPAQILYLNPNDHGWTNDAKIADLLAKINAAPSVKEAQPLWAELQEYASNEYVPVTPFGTYSLVAAARSNVKGFTIFQGPVVWNTSVQ
ncbi:ABC transporter substrate-binding protein [Neobacillus sp. Marseille-QA0830]